MSNDVVRACAWCGADLIRRRTEGNVAWAKRRFCSNRCRGASPQPRKEVPAYRTAHVRIVNARGPASDYMCACGAPACDWMFDNDPRGSLIDQRGHYYSTDPARYEPGCRNCHVARDIKKTHCLRGHEFTPENTYVRPDGKGRNCRACITIRSARQTRRRREEAGTS